MSSLTSVMAADATWSSECFQQWLLLPPLARCLNICSNNCLCSTDTSGQSQNNVCDPNQGVSVNINEGGDRQFHQIMEHEREWFLLSVRRGFTQTPLSLSWKLSKKPRVSDSHSGRVFTISLQPVCWQKRVHWNSFYRCQIDLTMPFKIWQKNLASFTSSCVVASLGNPSVLWNCGQKSLLRILSEWKHVFITEAGLQTSNKSLNPASTLSLVQRIWEQIRDFPSSTGIKLNQTYEVLQFKQHLGFLESWNSVECANSKTVTRSSRRSALFDLLDPTQPQIWPTDHRIW